MGKQVGDVYYLSLEDDYIEKISGIRKIVVPEGITILKTCYIMNLPDLEEIEFPSTLKYINNSSISLCPKLTVDGLKFKNNDFCIRHCSNSNIASEYCKKKLEEFINEDMPFEEKYKIYNQIVLSLPEEDKLRLSKVFIKEFEKVNYDMSFIINKINNNKILDCTDIQCFSIYLQKIMNLPINPIIIDESNAKIATATIDNIVDIGYESVIHKAKVKKSTEISDINAYILYVVCHEFQHIRQRYNSENIDFNQNDILKQLDYVDSKVQETKDDYEKGKGYSKFHDIFADEIRADIEGYDVLLTILNTLDNSPNIEKTIDYITNKKLMRIKTAHQIDENDNIGVYDYRIKAFNDLLAREDISSSEREKLTNLKKIYLEILKKMQLLNIDVYSENIEFYKENSNKKIK